MTSNIGASEIMEGKEKEAIAELKKYLKPEFINRIDEVITFNPINGETIIEIVKKILVDLSTRLLKDGYDIRFNDSKLIDKIIAESYDPVYGARPIKRYIQKTLENFLAEQILKNEVKKNISYVVRINTNNELEIKVPKID